jgi:START domain
MRAVLPVLLALTTALTSLSSWAQDWQPTKEVDGVQLFAKSDPNEGLKSFKGVIRIKATMKQALAAVLVRETFHDWVYNMLEDRTLSSDNADQSYCYMWIKGVWPTSDRDTVAKVSVDQDPKTLAVSVVARSAEQNRVPQQKDRVRMTNMYSGFTVVPISATETEVQLEGVADPAGSIPNFVTNMVAGDLPAKTLSALKARLESGKVDVKALETVPFAQIAMQKIKLPQ